MKLRDLILGSIGLVAAVAIVPTLPAFAGVWAGQKLRRRVNQEVFRKILLLAIFLLGLNLLRRALF